MSTTTPANSTAPTSSSSAKNTSEFVHLHVHSEYSLLDGGNKIEDLVARAKAMNFEALAVTDHGNLFGAIQFYTAARDAGIKPIIGIEAYMAPGDRRDRTFTGGGNGPNGVKDGGYHLLLLAANREGFQNLLRLSTIAYTDGFYYKPRIDKETLRAHSAGLIATSACLAGEIPTALARSDRKKAREIAEEYLAIFGPDRFFIELQKHIPEQDRLNPELIDLADSLGIGIVATNDVHFLRAEDHAVHDCLCCISTGKLVTDESRLIYPTQLYLRSAEEMRAASDLPRWQQACDHSLRIARLCNLELDFKTSHAPVVKPEPPTEPRPPFDPADPNGWFTRFCAAGELKPFDALHDTSVTREELTRRCDSTLRELCEAGLLWRYSPEGVTPEIRARLDRELSILAGKSISAYFLIVWDFVNWARQRGIPALARGSGVGTMVGYVLGLSNACPVKYGLLFERFTDPDRSEYPDIDIDICQDGRAAVLDYVRRKYGHVAQIITFGTLKARAAIKDVGRVLGFGPGETQRLANLVPDELNITLDRAIAQEPDLKHEYESRPEVRRLFDVARALEGQVRHSGIHAAGVVIATQPLDTIVPLCRPTGAAAAQQTDLVTQWDGPTVEKLGLLKMDFLGLRTLSIIERARTLIRDSLTPAAISAAVGRNDASALSHYDPLDLDRLECDDPRVFELFQRGDTGGVFQFESGGMRRLVMEMKPDRLEDLIAANALYRPGPMDLIPHYNRRKHGQEPVPAVHAIVDRYTAETYGIMVYQEQVMQICHELGGIPLRAAYSLIKAISKKKQVVINRERPVFLENATQKGLSRAKAVELFEYILKFAGYGFNKSHSTGYAIIAYQTAYLKSYFPNQYFAAMLSYESRAQKVADWSAYLDDCRKARFPDGHVSVDVRPPDINRSDFDFSVVFDDDEPRDHNHGHVRFGLAALKGAGDKAITAVIDDRHRAGPFRSIFDFCERVPMGAINRATIEALVKAGAFDSLHGMESRAAMVDAIPAAVAAGTALSADRAAGQGALFGASPHDKPLSNSSSPSKTPAAPSSSDPPLPRIRPWDISQTLSHEKEVLGFYVSSHPLDRHRDAIESFATTDSRSLVDLPDRTPLIVAGVLSRVRPTLVKSGKSVGEKMAMITLEDHFGTVEAVLFSDVFARCGRFLTSEAIVFLVGEVDHSRGTPSIRASDVVPVERAPAELASRIELTIDDRGNADTLATLDILSGLLARHARLTPSDATRARPVPVRFLIATTSNFVTLDAAALRVAATPEFLADARQALGPTSVRVRGGVTTSRRTNSSRPYSSAPPAPSASSATNGSPSLAPSASPAGSRR